MVKTTSCLMMCWLLLCSCVVTAAQPDEGPVYNPRGHLGFEEDTLKTNTGDLKLTFIGHGTLMVEHGGRVVHIDPVARYADYSKMPKADVICITHDHGDHLDPKVVEMLRKKETTIVVNEACANRIKGSLSMKNGDIKVIDGLGIKAVPAYNIVHKRGNGAPFHPKGRGNGYVLNFADKNVYVAGDTENTPEMKALEKIDIAFLPMNLPYTMTPAMVADAARAFKPRVLYPYHYGKTDPQVLVDLLKDVKDVEVRIRKLQ